MAEAPFTFTLIADTSGPFADFAPFVPSIDSRGRVAFWASLRGGGSGIFRGDGRTVEDLALTGGDVLDFISHPDLADDGSWCAYAELGASGQAVVRGRDGTMSRLADTSGAFSRIGPLGPTMNGAGAVAFRADDRAGSPGIFESDGASTVTIADSRRFTAYHGLPVVNGSGRVVFRADLENGVRCILASDGGTLTTVADTTGPFAELGAFPSLNEAGAVAFAATLKNGRAGVYVASGGEVARVFDGGDVFESVRGALLDDAGGFVFFGTKRGGTLGIYDAAAREILALGTSWFGSTVADFALNPVSFNASGQLAVRIGLASGVQQVGRIDPRSAARAGLTP